MNDDLQVNVSPRYSSEEIVRLLQIEVGESLAFAAAIARRTGLGLSEMAALEHLQHSHGAHAAARWSSPTARPRSERGGVRLDRGPRGPGAPPSSRTRSAPRSASTSRPQPRSSATRGASLTVIRGAQDRILGWKDQRYRPEVRREWTAGP